VTAGGGVNGFTRARWTSYALSATAQTSIVGLDNAALELDRDCAKIQRHAFRDFGSYTHNPATTWDLNPDTVMVPAEGP